MNKDGSVVEVTTGIEIIQALVPIVVEKEFRIVKIKMGKQNYS
jgi:hypothetical protein